MSSNISSNALVITDITYSKDSSCFVACTQNGLIYMIDTKTNKIEHIRCSDACYCLSIFDDHLFVGTNRPELEVRSFPYGHVQPSVLFLDSPVSSIFLSNSLLFVGTKNFTVVLVDLNDKLKHVKYFWGHNAAILYVNFHFEKGWLGTSACDGCVIIFDVNKQTIIKKLNILSESQNIETSTSLAKFDWDTIEHIINVISFSSCKTLFIVGCVNGQLSIINRITFHICFSFQTKAAVCSISWDPIATNKLVCCNKSDIIHHFELPQHLFTKKVMSLDALFKINNDAILNTSDYIVIYVIFYLMNKNIFLMNYDETIESYRKNFGSFSFDYLQNSTTITFQMIENYNNLSISIQCATPKFKSDITIPISNHIEGTKGNMSIRDVDVTEEFISKKFERTVDFLAQLEHNQLMNTDQEENIPHRKLTIVHQEKNNPSILIESSSI